MDECGKKERGMPFNGGVALGSSHGLRIGQIATGRRRVRHSSASTISAFCFPNFGFTEPFIRAILSYFELF
jgi:hypothetical protein